MTKSKIYILLLLIFLAGYFLRIQFLPGNSLTFGYDQARDAIYSLQIAGGDLKTFGPPSSTPGLFHGVLYYYLLAPAYLLGAGSPITAAYWIAFINALTVFTVFILAFKFTGKVAAGLIAALLFGASFESAQYATWLSNPTIAIFSVPLMYLGLWFWITKSKEGFSRLLYPLITAFGLGMSVQSEIFLIYHIIPVLIWLYVSRKNITKKEVLMFLLVFCICISTMVFAQLKFGLGSTITGIKALAISQDQNLAYAKSIGDYLVLYLNQIGRIYAFNSYPGNIGYGGGLILLITLGSLFMWVKSNTRQIISWQPFLATWLFSHITVVTVGGTSTPFLMVGIGPAVSIILAVLISKLYFAQYKLFSILLLFFVIFGNLSMIYKENSRGSTLFAIQKDMLLAKQIDAIDYTYNQADGKPFTINSLTSPLWINIVWTYLYKWHGNTNYGYLPGWTGRDQIGQIDSLSQTKLDKSKHFLIIEPMGGIPPRFLDETLAEENAKTKIVGEKYFGELRIQERIIN